MHKQPAYLFVAFLAIAWLVLPSSNAAAQSAAQKLEAYHSFLDGQEALENGDPDGAIRELRRARKLAPKNMEYGVLLAQAYMYADNPKKAIATCKKLSQERKATPEVYRTEGKAFAYMDRAEQARAVFRQGLERFPTDGGLHEDLGVISLELEAPVAAQEWWEKGIQQSPWYASNYFRAAKLHFENQNFLWSALYAEMFLNLERQGARTEEMSRLLYESYERSLRQAEMGGQYFDFTPGDDAAAPAFFTDDLAQFEARFTEAVNATPLESGDTLDLLKLARIRIKTWHFFASKGKNFPVFPFEKWYREVESADHLMAYQLWLLFDARPDAFGEWYETHRDDYDPFEAWFLSHPLYDFQKKSVCRRNYSAP